MDDYLFDYDAFDGKAHQSSCHLRVKVCCSSEVVSGLLAPLTAGILERFDLS